MSVLSLKREGLSRTAPQSRSSTAPTIGWTAVGRNGRLYYSPCGEHWTEATPSLHSKHAVFITVASSDGQLVAVGNRIAVSSDGMHWHTRVHFTEGVLNDVAFGDGTWMCVGSQGMRLFSVDNGATWTHTQAQERATLCSIAWGNNRFVAVGATSAGQGFVHVSMDGETGEDIRLGAVPLTRIVFGNGRFVAVDESGIAYVSQNGQDWTAHDLYPNQTIHALRYVNGAFLARCQSKTYSWSIDGQDWSEVCGFLPQCVVYGHAKYMGISVDGTLFSARIMDSWSQQVHANLRVQSLTCTHPV